MATPAQILATPLQTLATPTSAALKVTPAASAPLQPVPMLDFSREYGAIRDEVLAALTAVCDSQHFILGPAVTRFEAAAALSCHTPFAAGCGSGTDALWLALAALGIGAGDAVITSPFSFFATASAILRTGATPVFADIDPLTFNLSATAVEEVLQRSDRPDAPGTSRTLALLPIHLYGQCADMDALGSLAESHSLHIVEDAAQAFGAAWNGRRAGSLGATAAFSFYPTKNLSAMGEAGLVTTRDPAVDDRIRALRAHGMRQRYFHDEIGWNSRLDTLQAAVLEVKLRRLDAGNARRRTLAALYAEAFLAAGLVHEPAADLATSLRDGRIVLPHTATPAEHTFHQFVIRTPRRDELRAALAVQGIGSEIYYPLPLHLQRSLVFLGYNAGDFPHAERAAREVLALPIYPELREDEVLTVVEAICRFHNA